MREENDFITVDWHESIWRRPAMYVGSTGILGLQYLVRALLNLLLAPRAVALTLRANRLMIDAVATPLSCRPRKEGLPPYMIELCTNLITPVDDPPTVVGVEVLDIDVTPAQFRRTNQAPSALAMANALSDALTIESRQEGKASSARFLRGALVAGPEVTSTSEEDGVRLMLVPDPHVFGSSEFRFEALAEIARDVSAVRRIAVRLMDEARNLHFTATP